MKEIISMNIPRYPRRIKVADKRREQYYAFTKDGDFVSGNKFLPAKFYNLKDPKYPLRKLEKSFTNLKGEYTTAIYEGSKILGYFERTKDGEVGKFIDTVPVGKWKDNIKKTFLFDITAKERVLANPKVAGTPRYKRINFQDMYSGNLNEHTRVKMIEYLHDFFKPYVEKLPVIDKYPILVGIEFIDTVKNHFDNAKDDYGRGWDVDNRGIVYAKAFMDMLVKEGKIFDDDRMYVTGPAACIFTPLPDNDHRKRLLRITIFHDDRPIIQNNKYYRNYEYRKPNKDNGPAIPW